MKLSQKQYQIYIRKEFFKDLTDIMEDEKFMKFFTKYMGSWLDINHQLFIKCI